MGGGLVHHLDHGTASMGIHHTLKWFSGGHALVPCVTLSGDTSVVTPGGFATGISHSEASRDAVKHPIVHRTDPPPP